MAVTGAAATAASNLCGEAGGDDEGSGRAVGSDVGREEVEPGDLPNAEVSVPGRQPNILIFDVFPVERKGE